MTWLPWPVLMTHGIPSSRDDRAVTHRAADVDHDRGGAFDHAWADPDTGHAGLVPVRLGVNRA